MTDETFSVTNFGGFLTHKEDPLSAYFNPITQLPCNADTKVLCAIVMATTVSVLGNNLCKMYKKQSRGNQAML